MVFLFYFNCIFIVVLFVSIIEEYTPEQFVMISASEPYIYYLPIIISAWNRIGFKCIIVLVYHKLTTKYIYVREYIATTNSIIIELKTNKSIDANNISRLGRIFAFVNLSLYENTLLMTADIDILPIKESYFKCKNPNYINIKSFDLNGYGKFPVNKRWAMSYIMMTLKNWNEILRKDLNKCNSILTCVNKITKEAQERNISYYGGSYRRIDEIYMRDIIRNSIFFPYRLIFTLHGSYERRPCNILNKTVINDIHLPKIKNNEEWKIYVYCIISSFDCFNNSRNYIMKYLNNFNSLEN